MATADYLNERELPEIEGRLKVVNLQPGDVLVLTHPTRLPGPAIERIQDVVKRQHGVKCMVLSGGLELTDVLRQEEPCPTDA